MRKFQIVPMLLAFTLIAAACGQAAPAPTAVPAAPTQAAAPAATTAPTSAPAQAATSAPTAAATKAATVAATTAATSAATAAATSAVTSTTAVTSTNATTATNAAKTQTLTLTFRSGLKWSDGSPFTSKDVVGTYDLYWATQADPSWTYLSDVVAKDDRTVDFSISTPSTRIRRLILKNTGELAYKQYGKWMDQAHALRVKGAKTDSDEVKKLVEDIQAFKPDDPLTLGPYKFDPKALTEAQLELVKNPNGFNADKLGFDKIIVYYGETTETTPLVLSRQMDYATHAYPPSTQQSIAAMPGMQVLRAPTGSGPGLWFNEKVPPLDKKEVRQAFAYVLDRSENALVAYGESGKPLKNIVGFIDLLAEQWLTADQRAKLNPYNKDLQKADSLLSGLGYKKGGDGVYADSSGKRLDFELKVPADFTEYVAAAQNASDQLNKFGIKTSVKTYESSQRAKTQKDADYQILVDISVLTSYPHPYRAYSYNLTAPRNDPGNPQTKGGINFPFDQTLPDGTKVNLKDAVAQAIVGFDMATQQKYIWQIAQVYNDQLPILPLWERYSADPIDTTTRVTGWLPLNDPIYQNNQGGDNYAAIQFLNGTLKPAPSGDKTFRTGYPYIQPPKYDFNYFTDNSEINNLDAVSSAALYPPPFWYKWADGTWIPNLAEKYELK